MGVEPRLTAEEVRKVARLSRLAITDEQVEAYRAQLSSVLGYMERLRRVDLGGVEPLTHGGQGESINRLADDTPGPALSTEGLMGIAPDTWPPFLKVPKVIDAGGGGGA